jgi:Fe-S oxidoreductase
MTLAQYETDMAACSRCSSCKWVPFNQIKSWRFARNCPALARFSFHAYSGTGRMSMGLSMLKNRSELSEEVAEIIYRCQLCGACDVSCKVYRDDIDLSEVLMELRASCVESGQLIADHMLTIDALKKENNVFGEPQSARAAWAEGLGLKDTNQESAQVLLHAGCRYSYDSDLWPALRQAARLLQRAGIDVGIAGVQEACCGGRVYELGYQGDAANFADDMISRVKASGAELVVTACSDCFAALRFLYPRMGKDTGDAHERVLEPAHRRGAHPTGERRSHAGDLSRPVPPRPHGRAVPRLAGGQAAAASIYEEGGQTGRIRCAACGSGSHIRSGAEGDGTHS